MNLKEELAKIKSRNIPSSIQKLIDKSVIQECEAAMQDIRILFLDIDGVLNSQEYTKWCYTDDGKQYLVEGGDIFVDRNAVNLIKRLCDEYDVRIVISSSWRDISLSATIKSFEEYKDLKCLNKYIVGITPKYHSENLMRGEEINVFYDNIRHFNLRNYDKFYDRKYFSNKNFTNVLYCIVDDDTDMLRFQECHFIKIDNRTGITEKDINKVKHILKL